MNPTTTLTNNNPPATHECGLNPSPICREESETPQYGEHAAGAEAMAGSMRPTALVALARPTPVR